MIIDSGVFLQILCYCKFPLSHCHQYCHHHRMHPYMVGGTASMDARAILHMQKNCTCSCGYGCAYSPTPEHKSSLAESRRSLAEYQGALGPITDAAVAAAGPAQAARTAACPRGTAPRLHPSSPHPMIPSQLKPAPRLSFQT